MVVPKPLHLATNLQELQNKGKIGDVGKLKVYQLCQNGQKVLKEAIMKQYLGDEEHAYFLYFKFVEFIQKVREHPVFLDNSKYFMNLYNIPKNLKAAEDALEALSNSLECRYEVQRKEDSLKIFDGKFSKLKKEQDASHFAEESEPQSLEHAAKSVLETQRSLQLLQTSVLSAMKCLDLVNSQDENFSHEAVLKVKDLLNLVGKGLEDSQSVLEIVQGALRHSKVKEEKHFDINDAMESEDESFVFTSSKPTEKEILNVDVESDNDKSAIELPHCQDGTQLFHGPVESRIVGSKELMKKIFSVDNLGVKDLLNCRLVSR